jgi:hypothetical protein
MPLGGSGRFRLQAEELHVLGRQRVGVILPPASLIRLHCEGEKLATAGLGDFVEIQQFLDFIERKTRLAEFIPADLRRGPAKGLGYYAAGSRATESAKLSREAAPSDRRAWGRYHVYLPCRTGLA